MEQHIGRELENNEYISYVNGNQNDLRIENLIIVKREPTSKKRKYQQTLFSNRLSYWKKKLEKDTGVKDIPRVLVEMYMTTSRQRRSLC